MREKFVVTENVQKTFLAAEALWESVLTGQGLGLLDGRTGLGKTWAVERYVVQNARAVYLRSHKKWSASWMMEDIALALNLASLVTTKKNVRQVIDELKRRPRMLLIDEGDRVIRREDLLETLRDLLDFSGAPVILVSEGSGREAIYRKSERTWRRLGEIVEFKPLTVADVQMMALELMEPPAEIPRALAVRIHEEAKTGQFGEVIGNLKKVERLVKANPGTAVTEKVMEMALKERKAAAGG
jgi:DNA transposition AAA+ family ATPase